MNYTLDQLLALEAVHRLGSFAAAAKSLYRATSAISYSIRSLEEALEVDLFDRSGHRAVLTPEGEVILLEAKRVLQQARRLEQMGKELHAGYEPILRIVLDGIFPHGSRDARHGGVHGAKAAYTSPVDGGIPERRE